jgi:hypothetical protein
MRINHAASIIFAVAGLFCAPELSFAQNAPAAPPAKTIGVPSSVKPQIVPSLIVMNSRGANLQGQTLTLTGVASNSIVFADRPIRAAGHDLTVHLLEEWAGGDSFGKDPPNATVSVLNKDGSAKDVVVVLKSPKMDGDKLTFDVQVLEGDLAGADGPAAIFIDIIGRPLTPLSYAGVALRTAYRGAMYGGAAYGAAAVGAAVAVGAAAAYGAPYGYPYAPPACGYYPYPPCY